jgi:hypothetical protein
MAIGPVRSSPEAAGAGDAVRSAEKAQELHAAETAGVGWVGRPRTASSRQAHTTPER